MEHITQTESKSNPRLTEALHRLTKAFYENPQNREKFAQQQRKNQEKSKEEQECRCTCDT